MKVFFVVAVCFFVAAQALSDEEKAAIGKLYTACVSSTNADEALIKKLRAGEDVTDENVKKYVGCMFTKLNFINAAGELQEEAVKSKIPADFDHDEAIKIISECKEVKGEDADGTAFEAYKCFLKKKTSTKPLIDF